MADSSDARASHLIAQVWQRSQAQVLARLTKLESAAAAAHTGTLAEPQRAEAESIAHKLSGSLGMFGFPKGTQFARALEAEFQLSAPDPATLASLSAALRAELFPATS
jgi:HPt (histidine-containing phosphotransfer) domain-containing protein